MKAILILAGPYSSCLATKIIWQDLCLENNIDFEMHDLSEEKGKQIAEQINIKSFPALIVDNNVVAVGHPNEKIAKDVIKKLVD